MLDNKVFIEFKLSGKLNLKSKKTYEKTFARFTVPNILFCPRGE